MKMQVGKSPTPKKRIDMENAVLKIINGPAKNREYPLNLMKMALGRNDPPNFSVDIDLSDCEPGSGTTISRNHAEIKWVEGQLQIVDMGSANGTFVDGKQLISVKERPSEPPAILELGSKIALAKLEMVLDIKAG